MSKNRGCNKTGFASKERGGRRSLIIIIIIIRRRRRIEGATKPVLRPRRAVEEVLKKDEWQIN